ncbi:hypothetical protein M426DRAFT_69266 [Hypoxylon sp. CI-4A]|nr:hypothetical protein M426DRAFT_69266 [Hypoxylon sp. CI-4A]
MPDGIELEADLYEPVFSQAGESPRLTLLVHGCYGRGFVFALVNARLYAARGFRVLFVSTRGTFGSGGGPFEPCRAEPRDSQAVVEWMRAQPWYPGSFATFGGSYLAHSQWALLKNPPKDCVASVILSGFYDFHHFHWGTGSFNLDRVDWTYQLAHQEDPGWIPAPFRAMFATKLLRSAKETVPLIEGAESSWAIRQPTLAKAMLTPDPLDPYWTALRHTDALERVNHPVFLMTGWYDIFLEQVVHQFERLHARGRDVRLVIGPWTHEGACGNYSIPDILKYLDSHSTSGTRKQEPPSACIYVTGVNEWRTMSRFPPETTRPRTLFLHDDKSLGQEKLAESAAATSFTFDPANPTPTVGGPLLIGASGCVNDTIYASRPDVLVFTTSPLEEDLEIMGRPSVQLAHSSDIPFIDLFIRISEVDARGVSYNITEGYQALDPDRDSAPIQLELLECAHRFLKGTQLRLIIAGGSFPSYARNLGTPGLRTTGKTMRSARHTLRLASGGCRLTLPTV